MTGLPRVLLVEDEVELRDTLRLTLQKREYDVETAAGGLDALALLNRWHPDVIVLDLGLPDVDGVEVLRRIRAQGKATRVVVLSARASERDKVATLDAGADDFLAKPFGTEELLARVRTALRHLGPPAATATQTFDDLTIDYHRRQVTVRGKEVRLSPIEWELLKVLVSEPHRVFTHQALLQQVWGPAYDDATSYLHVYVGSLRKKLERDPRHPRLIHTEPGVGYRFQGDCRNDG